MHHNESIFIERHCVDSMCSLSPLSKLLMIKIVKIENETGLYEIKNLYLVARLCAFKIVKNNMICRT
jgi:hypothetical protein